MTEDARDAPPPMRAALMALALAVPIGLAVLVERAGPAPEHGEGAEAGEHGDHGKSGHDDD